MKHLRRLQVCKRCNDGMVLIAVLIVVMLTSMIAVSLLFRMKSDESASATGSSTEQAWLAAWSGVEEAMRVAQQARTGSSDWMSDEDSFKQRLVLDDGSDRWYFSVYSSYDAEGLQLRHGLTDEASKLNINEVKQDGLSRLSRLTSPLVQALVDFMDADSSAHPEGAEQDYYDTLPQPYAMRNGPFSALEEIQLVRGFTPQVFYGEDVNLSFLLEPNEDDGDERFPPDNHDGRLSLGVGAWLTVYSYERNEDNGGRKRLNINVPREFPPGMEVPAPVAAYLQLMWSNHVQVAHPSELFEAKGTFKDAAGKAVVLDSGVGQNELAEILDKFTARNEDVQAGLVNINTAPVEVLMALPGLDMAAAEAIVLARKNVGEDKRATTAWLIGEGTLTAEQFKKVAPHITARSKQFAFHVAGYGLPSGRFRVLEVVIDTATGTPRIAHLRDLTKLGLPFKLSATAEMNDG